MTSPYFIAAVRAVGDAESELSNAREVLLEMDKIVAGHVAEVERLRDEVAEWKQVAEVEAHARRDFRADNDRLRALNAKMLAALKEDVRYLGYLAGETHLGFLGGGMPADALAQTRAIIAEAEGRS
jgi:hypothetical protein